MSGEDELREFLSEAATAISQTQNNPRTWHSWVVYLLERLEDKAAKGDPTYSESYRDMLSALQESLRNRVRTGGW